MLTSGARAGAVKLGQALLSKPRLPQLCDE